MAAPLYKLNKQISFLRIRYGDERATIRSDSQSPKKRRLGTLRGDVALTVRVCCVCVCIRTKRIEPNRKESSGIKLNGQDRSDRTRSNGPVVRQRGSGESQESRKGVARESQARMRLNANDVTDHTALSPYKGAVSRLTVRRL